MRLAPLIALLLACLALAACGGDDEPESAETAPATAAESAPAPATADELSTTAETETETAPAEEGADISRSDAIQETIRQSLVAADEVPDSDLYFASNDDVECEAPGATQPDNLNERAPEWTCELDAETNGVRCQGSARIVASPGANPGKTFEGIEAEAVEISCERA